MEESKASEPVLLEYKLEPVGMEMRFRGAVLGLKLDTPTRLDGILG